MNSPVMNLRSVPALHSLSAGTGSSAPRHPAQDKQMQRTDRWMWLNTTLDLINDKHKRGDLRQNAQKAPTL